MTSGHAASTEREIARGGQPVKIRHCMDSDGYDIIQASSLLTD